MCSVRGVQVACNTFARDVRGGGKPVCSYVVCAFCYASSQRRGTAGECRVDDRDRQIDDGLLDLYNHALPCATARPSAFLP